MYRVSPRSHLIGYLSMMFIFWLYSDMRGFMVDCEACDQAVVQCDRCENIRSVLKGRCCLMSLKQVRFDLTFICKYYLTYLSNLRTEYMKRWYLYCQPHSWLHTFLFFKYFHFHVRPLLYVTPLSVSVCLSVLSTIKSRQKCPHNDPTNRTDS